MMLFDGSAARQMFACSVKATVIQSHSDTKPQDEKKVGMCPLPLRWLCISRLVFGDLVDGLLERPGDIRFGVSHNQFKRIGHRFPHAPHLGNIWHGFSVC